MTRYFLRMKSAKVIGSVEITASSLIVAKALASEWARALDRKVWSLEITDEKAETQWTL